MEEEYDSDDELQHLDCVDDNDSNENSDDDINVDFPLDSNFKEESFRSSFVAWALKHNITRLALQEVGEIFNDYAEKDLLPKDPRTYLQTPRSVEIAAIGDGQFYWHNGLKLCLENVLKNISINTPATTISLNFNMDGLPVFKSKQNEFWPILCNIAEIPAIKPMVVGVYYGKAKTTNLNGYLMPLVNELEPILKNGITLNNGHRITVKIRSFICDSPARAYIKGK